jgi:hypothetical protein
MRDGKVVALQQGDFVYTGDVLRTALIVPPPLPCWMVQAWNC